MKTRTLRQWAAALSIAAALAACASPNPNLYTIAPVQGTPSPGAPKVIVLRELGLARYLDRSQIVRSSENYRLDVMSNDWWGESLSPMLSRVLVEELNQRLPGSAVYAEAGAVSATPDATVELNIERLDEDAAGNVVLLAQANVTRNGRRGSISRNISLTVKPAGPDVGSEVAAISSVVGQLADTLADMLRTR
jgi:uncharacterized protein